MNPVHIRVLLPGGSRIDLGTVEPQGDSMGFTTVVDVPAGTPAGTATRPSGYTRTVRTIALSLVAVLAAITVALVLRRGGARTR